MPAGQEGGCVKYMPEELKPLSVVMPERGKPACPVRRDGEPGTNRFFLPLSFSDSLLNLELAQNPVMLPNHRWTLIYTDIFIFKKR